jgi:hypothetical protein
MLLAKEINSSVIFLMNKYHQTIGYDCEPQKWNLSLLDFVGNRVDHRLREAHSFRDIQYKEANSSTNHVMKNGVRLLPLSSFIIKRLPHE